MATEQTSSFSGTSVSFTTVQLKTFCINLVVIDDCRDVDCPLVELSLSSLHLKLSLSSLHLKLSMSSLHLKQRQDGPFCLTYRLSASHYNREQSAWEPCMEPWGCTVDRISTQLSSKTQRNAVAIKSDEAGRVAGPLVELEDRKEVTCFPCIVSFLNCSYFESPGILR